MCHEIVLFLFLAIAGHINAHPAIEVQVQTPSVVPSQDENIVNKAISSELELLESTIPFIDSFPSETYETSVLYQPTGTSYIPKPNDSRQDGPWNTNNSLTTIPTVTVSGTVTITTTATVMPTLTPRKNEQDGSEDSEKKRFAISLLVPLGVITFAFLFLLLYTIRQRGRIQVVDLPIEHRQSKIWTLPRRPRIEDLPPEILPEWHRTPTPPDLQPVRGNSR